jgi:hypothetical protein
MNQQDANNILDGENYRKTESYGFREIVLKQVNRITDIYSSELTSGYWKYSQPDHYGNKQPLCYISDGRLSFIQSVECLHDLLMPKFDKQMKKDIEDIEAEQLSSLENCNKDLFEHPKDPSTIRANIKIKFSRRIFQKLCLFLERIGWLQESGIED